MAALSETTKTGLASTVYESQLLKFGTFTLKGGDISPFYLDLRKAQSHPVAFQAITKAYAEMVSDSPSTTFLAGVPEAATPLAAATGFYLKRALLQPRKTVKSHGTKNSVEGEYREGDRVILIDDLITKGDSKIDAIKQIEEAGLVVDRFIVLIDREQGGVEMLQQLGYTIEAGFTIGSLIKTLHNSGKISGEQKNTILSYIARQ